MFSCQSSIWFSTFYLLLPNRKSKTGIQFSYFPSFIALVYFKFSMFLGRIQGKLLVSLFIPFLKFY